MKSNYVNGKVFSNFLSHSTCKLWSSSTEVQYDLQNKLIYN